MCSSLPPPCHRGPLLQDLHGALESCLWRPLPAGWQSFTVAGSGVPFYSNPATGAKQWHRPTEDDEVDSLSSSSCAMSSASHSMQRPAGEVHQASLARVTEAAAQLASSVKLAQMVAQGAQHAHDAPCFDALPFHNVDLGRSHSWHIVPAQDMALGGAGRKCVSY